MHEVSKAINSIDPASVIDGKICKTASSSPDQDEADKCTKGSSGYGNSNTGLLLFTSEKNNSSIFSTNDTKLSAVPKATKTISTEISTLNKDQKGVVSSAFAKAHEGAEIVEIRSCYG